MIVCARALVVRAYVDVDMNVEVEVVMDVDVNVNVYVNVYVCVCARARKQANPTCASESFRMFCSSASPSSPSCHVFNAHLSYVHTQSQLRIAAPQAFHPCMRLACTHPRTGFFRV
jgi:hypothetical protein